MRKTTIITDPIHQVMNLGSDPAFRKCFKDVLDTRAFQRLRRITQLGLASYVFPGATHTRFSHSLGVAYLAHSVLTHLREWADSSEDQTEITDVFNEVLIGALLHDVGHGPFSHSFERVLKGYKCAPDHEQWTAMFISHNSSEIRQRLGENGIDVRRVASIFDKTSAGALARPYKQIVSSQLDVDRMDYLVRDSHFAGVAIGRVDVHYLIHSLVIVHHDGNGTKTLGITPKGVKAYEAFLLSRQLMNRTVYYHHNVKVLEFMMEHFLRLVIQHMQEITADASVAPIVPPYLKRVAQAIATDSSKTEFMTLAYEDYVRLTEDSVWNLLSVMTDTSLVPNLHNLALKIQARKILRHFQINPGKREVLRDALLNQGFREDVDFHLLDLKTTMYKGDDHERVFVLEWQGGIGEIAQYSDTISAFRDRPEAECLLIVISDNQVDAIEKLGTKGQFIVASGQNAVARSSAELISKEAA